MNKITAILIGSLLLVSAGACDNAARTSSQAPENANQTTQAPDVEKAQNIQKDGTSEVRKDQLNSDIRAREQRNKMAGSTANRTDDDLQSEVRSKLEANLPASQLTVEAKDGAVKIAGTVPTQPQLARIEPLAKEIYGVKTVTVEARVAPAQQNAQ
ncbi:BON domain-containing protein [Pantanalinema sp. GBBB05]|uniref:BON domain-containing protein n=1 Tax=Pantanalinema sp. GBBB05 TaxID=2604139 RepID=UPI001D6685BD|nr:BON domain-containing protein [Pantanalinema sp. GBBB05]